MKKAKKTIRKNKVLTTWMISYAMITLVALVTNSYVYWSSYRTIEKNIEDSHIFIAKELQAEMDNTIRAVNGFASKLFLHPSVKNFYRTSDISGFYKDFSGVSAFRSFNELMYAYIPYQNSIADYYLISVNGNLVWNNSAIRTMDYYEKNAHSSGNDGTNKLMSAYYSMEYPGINQIVPIETVTTPSASSCMLYYPLTGKDGVMGYMAALLDDGSIQRELKQLSSATSSLLFILDEEKNILYTNSADASMDFEHIALPELLNKNADQKINGDSYMLYASRSDNANIYYVAATPRARILDSLARTRQIIAMSVTVYLLISTALIVFSLHRNYRPMKKVREIIESHESEKYYTDNDYDLILYALAQGFNHKRAFNRVMSEHAEFLLTHHLNTMLKTNADYWKIPEDSLIELEEDYFGENYVIFLFLCEIDDAWKQAHSEIIAGGYSHFFENEIKHTLTGSLGDGYRLTETEVDDFTAFILKIDDERTELWKKDLKEAIAAVTSHLKTDFSLNSFFAIGSLQHSVIDCTAAYSEVVSLLSNVLLARKESVLCLDEYETSPGCRYLYTLDMEERFMNSFKTGTKEVILHEADSLWEQMSSQNLPWTAMHCFAVNMSSSLIKALQNRNVDDAAMLEIYHSIAPVLKAHSVPAQKKAFFEALRQAIDVYNATRDDTNVNHYLAELDALLEQHIYDDNLNVAFLADKIGINSKYLSAIYKETCGVSLLDTIHRRRIDYVKELLSSNVSIQDAACRVGYGSTITLTRWFKKYEGITPAQYRRLR